MYELIIGFFLIAFGYMYFDVMNDMRNKLPVAILDTQGIWTQRHGVITWKDIKGVALYIQVPPAKGRTLGVGIKIKKFLVPDT